MDAVFNEVKFTDADVVNIGDYDSDAHGRDGAWLAGACVPWLLHDHGFTVCVVFARSEQDALDEAADAKKLDRYLVKPEQFAEYGGEDAVYEKCHLLGNSGEPHDIEALTIVQLPNPKLSFAALFSAHQAAQAVS